MIRASAAAKRYQNTVNNAQGHLFEGDILRACLYYRDQGRAVIDKTPEPFRVMEKQAGGIFKGRFTASAQPDFQGTLASGRSIVFEAKFTTTDRLKQEIVTGAQSDALTWHSELGALAAICAGIGQDSFFIPWAAWRDMKAIYGRKYVRAEDVEKYRVKYSMGIMFLDYTSRERIDEK